MDALAGQLVLGDGVEVRDNVRIYSRGIEVGSRTTLGEGSFLNGRITVGEKAWIARNCDLAGEVCIEQAILGPNVSIIAALGHQRNPVTNAIAMSQRELKEPSVDLSLAKVKVLAGAWIGHGAIVLKGVTINPGVVVGAGSVVTKSFPAGTVVAGNPARPIQSKLSI